MWKSAVRILAPCILVLMTVVGLVACERTEYSQFVTWREEVHLNDGRIIVVNQKKRLGAGMARESWLTINLPEFSAQPITWHESLDPLIVNIESGKLYVVGSPPSVVEEEKYGNPHPDYVGFVWENGTWNRIPFEQIPQQIYDTNMLIDGVVPAGTTLLTLQQKNGRELNGRATQLPGLLRLDPHFR